MSSGLALCLCIGFVLFLLRMERRQHPGVSGAVWLPTVWSLVGGSRALSSWLSNSGEDPLSGNLIDQLFEGVILCSTLFVLSRRKQGLSFLIRENRSLILLLGYMLLSVFWSEIPGAAFKRWVKEFGAVAMAFLLATEASPREAVETLLRRTIYVLIPFSVLVIKYFQRLGAGYSPWTGDIEWNGVALQKNALGRLCLISAFFLIWTWTKKSRKGEIYRPKYQIYFEILLLMMTAWLLKGPSMWAASATAIGSLTAGLGAFACLRFLKKWEVRPRPGLFVVVLACIMGLGIITPLVQGATVGSFTSLLGRNSTLTGRTDLWVGLLPEAAQQPILGYGFSSFWTPTRHAAHIVGEAHNGYLEVLLGLGVVGLVFTLTFLLATLVKAAKALDSDFEWASLCICFILMASLHNFSESSFDSFGRHLMTMILFLGVSVSPSVISRSTRARSAPEDPDQLSPDLVACQG
jgi:exopolysaccharide production protein ExoQ